MSCAIRTSEKEDLLLAYSTGRLNSAQIASFEAHLRDCSDCSRAAAAQNAVWRALDAWSVPPVSPDFDRRLSQRIQTDVSWWVLAMRPLRALLAFRPMPAAATAALLLIAVFLLRTPNDISVAPAPDTAQVETVAPDQAESALLEMDTIREFSSLMRADATAPRM